MKTWAHILQHIASLGKNQEIERFYFIANTVSVPIWEFFLFLCCFIYYLFIFGYKMQRLFSINSLSQQLSSWMDRYHLSLILHKTLHMSKTQTGESVWYLLSLVLETSRGMSQEGPPCHPHTAHGLNFLFVLSSSLSPYRIVSFWSRVIDLLETAKRKNDSVTEKIKKLAHSLEFESSGRHDIWLHSINFFHWVHRNCFNTLRYDCKAMKSDFFKINIP